MKLPPALLDHISERIVAHLDAEGVLQPDDPARLEQAVAAVQRALTADLQVEDQLNEEVREILRSRADEMTRLGVQYHDMFRMIKNELVRKRKLIL
jgi:hypothetical protein